jgi:hypothetical protein
MSSGSDGSFTDHREGILCRWRQCQSTVAAFSNRGTTGRDCWRGAGGYNGLHGWLFICFLMIHLSRLVHIADELWESGSRGRYANNVKSNIIQYLPSI